MPIQARANKDRSLNSAFDCFFDEREARLAAKTGELAGLRLSVLLTAKWELEEGPGTDTRAQLHSELNNFRNLYFDKIDEIAMTFGIQEAIEAKQNVERSIELPVERGTGAEPARVSQMEI
jgi:hypothetical protein